MDDVVLFMVEHVVAISTVFGHGKTVIPAEIREYLNIKDGDKFHYVQSIDGKIYIVKGEKLKSCPKNIFRERNKI